MIETSRTFTWVLGVALPFLLLALGVQPSAAQYVPQTISAPYEVAVALQRLGMRPIATPRQRGLFWIAPAMERDGTRVTVVVEAGSGEIVNVDEIEPSPLRPSAPIAAAPGMRYGMRDRAPYEGPPARIYSRPAPSGVEDDELPTGPSVIPADPTLRPRGQVPTAPRIAARSADQKLRTAPLPRPRPSDLTATAPQPAPVAPAPAASPDAWGPPIQGFE